MDISRRRSARVFRREFDMAGLRLGAMVLAAGLSIPAAGMAAEPPPSLSPPAWTVTLGIEGRIEPLFPGASSYMPVPYPLFDVRRGGTPERFVGPRDGIGFSLYDIGFFRVGPVGQVKRARLQSSDTVLLGLGSVPWAGEIGGFAEYWAAPWLRGRGELRQGFGGHHGLVADLMLDAIIPVTPRLTWSGGPRLTLVTGAANEPYFSINYTQSVASGLPVYDAKGGVQSFGAGTQLRYHWTPAWATHVFVEYQRLAGGAANSPLVEQRGDPNQLIAGLGTTYSFNFRPLW
jgi:outer membrane protein